MANPDQPRFLYLLNKYQNHQSTVEEDQELFRMVRTGDYDHLIDASIEDLFFEEPASELPPERTEEILREILASDKKKNQVVSLTARSWWMAAAAVVVLTVSGWLVWHYTAKMNPVELHLSATGPATFKGKQFVRLPDGSMVILNDASELSYTAAFGKTAREVTLTGEGYFDVQHDPERPFRVLTSGVTTTVLGTAFNVKAYPGQEEVLVTVVRGTVQVGDSERTYGTLTPDQQIAVNTTSYAFVKTELKAESAVAWKKSFLILDDVSMAEAAEVLEGRYDIAISFTNQEFKDCRFTATFIEGESLEQILEVVTGALNATYTMDKKSITLTGKGC